MQRILTFLSVLIASPTWGGTITMDFTVTMDWRFDLGKNAMDSSFRPMTINVQAVVDDKLGGTVAFPPSTTRILFGGVRITSPLPKMVSMGYDVSSFGGGTSTAIVQDTFITQTNQGTWTQFNELRSASGVMYSKDLQFTNDPRLSDPSHFGTEELWQLLSSHLNKQYTYREDITFPGGGFQHHGYATLTKITRTSDPIGQPTVIIPHIAAGGTWSTTARFYNTTDTSQTVRLEFFDANGLAQPIRANGVNAATATYDLTPFSTLDVVLDGPGSATKIGYAKVVFLTSTDLRMTVFYSDSGGVEGAVSTFGSTASSTFPFDMTDGVGTSIAIVANQDSAIPRIGLTCYGSAGNKIEPVGLTSLGQKYAALDLISLAPQLAGQKGFCTIVEQASGTTAWTAARHHVVSLRFKGRSFVPTTF